MVELTDSSNQPLTAQTDSSNQPLTAHLRQQSKSATDITS